MDLGGVFDYSGGGCVGLDFQIAISASEKGPVHAEDTSKSEGPFYCPDCLSEVVVRKCDKKIDHFAHKARQTPIITKNESQLHLDCKNEICNSLRQLFPSGKWEVERHLPPNKKKGWEVVVPDISGRINGKPIVIEVQVSQLSVEKIRHRTRQYYLRNCAILWVIPLKSELGIEKFRPRHFESFLHSMYFGRCYYWSKGNGSKVLPVHFGEAERYIDESYWFDSSGDEMAAGGFFKPYKTLRLPVASPLLDIAEDFEGKIRNSFEPSNEKLWIPRCAILFDKLSPWWKSADG